MKRNIIVIGASAGGVEAVPRLLGSLPENIEAAFFVTLHVPPSAKSIFPELISRKGRLPAEHARDGSVIHFGRIYVAPPDHHLVLDKKVMRLNRGPKENHHRPAIDPLFRSAAQAFGARVAGVLLTGNLDDGIAGLRCIQQQKGLTIVQDPAEAPYPELPRNALHALEPHFCMSLLEIERLLKCLPNEGVKVSMKHSKAKGSLGPARKPGEVPISGEPIPLSCPECHGPMWEIRDGKLLRFQCMVGHRYSVESLLSAHYEELETALWIALRTLEERINLQRRLVQQSREAGRVHGSNLFKEGIAENTKHAQVLRSILDKLSA